MIGSLLARAALVAASFGFVGGSKAPGDRVGATGIRSTASVGVNSKVLSLHGSWLAVPPGVHVLSDTAMVIGMVTVEFPDDVTVEFNEKGEAVFSLMKSAKPRSWVLKVGKKKYVASATARAIVPLLGVGEPRIEWSRFAFSIPAPRDFVHQANDLKDPFDASPFR